MKNLICLVIAFGAFAARADDPRLIEVSSFAEKAVDPDLLRLNVEIWSKAATAQRAQTLAAEKTKEVRGILDQFKIRKEDIQTVSFDFGPEYVWDNGRNRNRLVGFRSTQTLQTVLRKTDQAGKFVDALTQSIKGGGDPKADSGVNINSIRWDTSKRDELETTALADAVKSTRAKAEEIAKAAGVKIRSVYRLAHVAGGDPVPARPYRKVMTMMAADAAPETSMAEGQIKIRVNVGAAYEIGK